MPYPEPIRVLSDLHLAHAACRIDDPRALKPLLDGAGTVIFNGDTCELRSSALRERAEAKREDLLAVLHEVGAQGVFLRGNHDPFVSDLEFWEDASGGVLVIHGDCLFPSISPWNPKTWALKSAFREVRERYPEERLRHDLDTLVDYTQACRMLCFGDESTPLSPPFRRLRSVLRIVSRPRRILEILRCWGELGGRLRRFHRNLCPEKRLVLVGHTHRPGIIRLGGDATAVNTGGFLSVGGAWTVDLIDGLARVRRIDEPAGGFRRGPVLREIPLGGG